MKTMTWMAAVAALAMAAGCNERGDDDAAAPAPDPSQKAQVQKADAAAESMDAATEAANDAIVDSGSGGAATSTKAGTAGKSYAASSINYQASLDLLVDLDATDGNGNDLHPRSTGVIHVVASGSVTGTEAAGEVNYAVTVTTDTAVTCTDPHSGATASVAAGAVLSYALQITWSKTDDQNWTITASCDASLADYVLTVTKGAEMVTVSVDWEKHGDITFKAVNGTFSANASGSESAHVEIADGNGTQVVILSEVSGSWMITVDAQAFGPYTEAQAEATFGIVIE